MRIVLTVMAMAVAGCITLTPQPIRCEAEVVKFMPQARHMDWEDGRWETFGVVQLRILSPADRAGETIAVSIHPESTNSFLRLTGTKCSFLIAGELMPPANGKHMELFEVALENLKGIDAVSEPKMTNTQPKGEP